MSRPSSERSDSFNNGIPRVPAFLTDSRAFTFIQGLAETAGISSRPVSPNPQDEADADDESPSVATGPASSPELGTSRKNLSAGAKTSNSRQGGAKKRPSTSPTQQRRWSANSSPVHSSLPMSSRSISAGGNARSSPQRQEQQQYKFSRKHIEQAVRLASEASDEDRKGKAGDAEYAVDCYFSSLDYLLSALPPSTAAELLSGNPQRRSLLQSKLTKLVDKLGGPLSPSVSSTGLSLGFPTGEDGDAVPQGGSDKWWLVPVPARLRRRTTSAPASALKKKGDLASAEGDTVSGAIQPPTDLVAACSCGRKVTIQLPQWVLDSARNDTTGAGGDNDQLPKTWSEALIAASVGIAVLIKQSPIPYLFQAIFTSIISLVLFLDARFQLRTRVVMFMGDALEALVELDKTFGLHQAAGEAASVVWEAGIRAAVAFARADGYRPSPQAAPVGFFPSRQQQQQPPPPELEITGASGTWDAVPTNVSSLSSAYDNAPPQQRRMFASRGAQGLSPVSSQPSSGTSTPVTGQQRRANAAPSANARRAGAKTSGSSSAASTSDSKSASVVGYNASGGGPDAPPSYGVAVEEGGAGSTTPRSGPAAGGQQAAGGARNPGWARSAAESVAGRLGFPPTATGSGE